MQIDRRAFMAGSLAAGLACVARAQEPVPRGLILSAPLTHSDWMLKSGIQWGEAGVRHMLDACKASGWSRIYWRVLDGGRALYPSANVRPENKWDEDSVWTPTQEADKALAIQMTGNLSPQRRAQIISKFNDLNYEKFDSLAAAVSYGHKIGLEIHAWVSINEDDHGWGLQSDFSKQHPEFRWVKRDGRRYRSQLSFAFPQVREYKLSILDELLRRHDIDGIFLDWIRTGDVRDNPQTDPSGVADSGYEQPLVDEFKARHGVDPHDLPNADQRWVKFRAQPQTLFMRAARQRIAANRREVPLSVMVAHPWHYRGNLRGLLLDVATWASEGLIDSAVAAGYYRDGGNAEKPGTPCGTRQAANLISGRMRGFPPPSTTSSATAPLPKNSAPTRSCSGKPTISMTVRMLPPSRLRCEKRPGCSGTAASLVRSVGSGLSNSLDC